MTADYITLAPHLTDALWPGGVPTLELEEIFLQGAVLVALPYLDGDPVFKGHPRAVIEEDFKTKMRAALRILRADTGPVN